MGLKNLPPLNFKLSPPLGNTVSNHTCLKAHMAKIITWQKTQFLNIVIFGML
jgi:hypothetical protein